MTVSSFTPLAPAPPTAASSAFTPAGNIAATTVAGALVELDDEKVAKAGDTMTGTLRVPSLGVGSAALSNVGTNLGGTIAGAAGVFGVYMGQMVLNPGNATNAYFQYAGGGAVDTAGPETVGQAVGFYAAPITKTGAGAISSTFGVYVDPSSSGAANWGVGIETASHASLWLGLESNSTTFAGGIIFRADQSVNLYASAADTLKTDDAFVVGGAYASIGPNPAASGALRLANAATVSFRNSTNLADVAVLTLGAADNTALTAPSGKAIFLKIDTASILSVSASGLEMNDAYNIVLNATTGTKIGTAANQKLALWNAQPDVQPTTAITGATFVEGAGGTAVNSNSTFDGYTLAQIVAGVRRLGALA